MGKSFTIRFVFGLCLLLAVELLGLQMLNGVPSRYFQESATYCWENFLRP